MSGFPARAPSPPPELAPGRIHLWSLRLDPPPTQVSALEALLSPDERGRAARFRFDKHRRQYAVGRGALRLLLGAYLDLDPARVAFSYGPRGKPFLATPAASGLQFNLSNSDERALIGLVLGREIGVDLELAKPMPDCEEIAERFFSASEREVLRGLPAERKEEGFFNCWTRKEAYLKAVGEGLAAPLDSFDVTLAPGEAPRMLTLEGDAERARRWFFADLRPAERYAGALAIEGEPEGAPGAAWQVDRWELSLDQPLSGER